MKRRPREWEAILAKAPKAWNPGPKNLALVMRAQAAIDSLGGAYIPSLRWVFYRLLQADGIPLVAYTGHKDLPDKVRKYLHLKDVLGDARHVGLMSKTAMVDEGRNAETPFTFPNGRAWLEMLAGQECDLDPWADAPERPLLVFEANAMLGQFRVHSRESRVELWPFGGSPSIEYKYRLAKRLASEPTAVILYFGDLDPAGRRIAKDTGDAIRWSGRKPGQELAYRVGLTERQARAAHIPDMEGKYQWEALDDGQAGRIIRAALDTFERADPEALALAEGKANRAAMDALAAAIEDMDD